MPLLAELADAIFESSKKEKWSEMKQGKTLWMALMWCLIYPFGTLTETPGSGKTLSPTAAASIQPFLGRWDLTLKTPDREYGSWLEIRHEKGQLKAQMVGRWGNARPLPRIEIKNGLLEFVSPKEEEDRQDDMVFKGKLVGASLSGSTTGPDGKIWQWTGKRVFSLKRTAVPQWL